MYCLTVDFSYSTSYSQDSSRLLGMGVILELSLLYDIPPMNLSQFIYFF